MPTVYFIATLPECASGRIVDFSGALQSVNKKSFFLPLGEVYQKHETKWKNQFLETFACVNRQMAGVQWWAFSTSAKNFLSSCFGNRVFQLLALMELASSSDDDIYVLNSSTAQVEAFKRWAEESRACTVKVHTCSRKRFNVLAGLRIFYQLLRVWLWFIALRPMVIGPKYPRAKIWLMSYIDERATKEKDLFFGRLPSKLREECGNDNVQITAFVHSRYRKVLPRLTADEQSYFFPFYNLLKLTDFLFCYRETRNAVPRKVLGTTTFTMGGVDVTPLLIESMEQDLFSGNYLHNMFVYRSFFRLIKAYSPEKIIYPFENKSLEKMMVLAVRESAESVRLIGYQHTSITPRHTTLLFGEGEARITPLPDRVVTVGDVTRKYLEEHGGYPQGMLSTGCVLRQELRQYLALGNIKRHSEMRILLALSSSRDELISAVSFLKEYSAIGGSGHLGIRPHPEFPLTLLPNDLAEWVETYATDYSGTSLAENIAWCGIVVYISSTVALEGLAAGRAIVNLRLNDVIDPDPVLEELSAHWKAETPEGFREAVDAIGKLDDESIACMREESEMFVTRYFHKPDKDSYPYCFLNA